LKNFAPAPGRRSDALPLTIGDWDGKRQALDREARDLLKPNAEATLLYHNRVKNVEAYLAVVQGARLPAHDRPHTGCVLSG